MNKNAMENQPESFYNTFDKDGDNVTYSEEGFDKIVVNFVSIEAFYTKCRAIFPSRLKLHNQLKSRYLERSSLVLPILTASSILVIASKTIH